MADASSGENGPIADMDQPFPHTVLAGGTEPVQTGHIPDRLDREHS